MPKILDLELSDRKFALRLAVSAILGVLVFLFLFYIPSNLSAIIMLLGSGLPLAIPVKELESLIQQSVPPALPVLGLIIVVLTVLGVLLKKTLLEGPLVSTSGLVDLVYAYVLFQGGMMIFNVPEEMVLNTRVGVSVTLTLVMVLFMAAATLNIIKGILITVKHREQQRKSESLPAENPISQMTVAELREDNPES